MAWQGEGINRTWVDTEEAVQQSIADAEARRRAREDEKKAHEEDCKKGDHKWRFDKGYYELGDEGECCYCGVKGVVVIEVKP